MLNTNFVLHLGLLHKIMSYRGFVVFGRLSYSVMLVNLTVMIMSQSTQKTPHNLSFKSVVSELYKQNRTFEALLK